MNPLLQQLQVLSSSQPLWVQTLAGLSLLVLTVFLLHVVARPLVLRLVHVLVARSPIDWDETIFEHRAPHRLSLLIPLLVLQGGLPLVPGIPPAVLGLMQRLVVAIMILVVAMTVDSLLSAAHTLYARTPLAATRPIKSYVQLVKVAMYAIAGIFIVARLADQSPWYFVSGLGAMMAVILLVFRDTLLSLVASIQLTNNDLVRVGDWIEMPQFGADGFVTDISLSSVTVANWDRTNTVIPTHKFLDNSFRNWRGMFDSGGRRIKRAIHLDLGTVRFLTPAEIERFGRFALLKDYIAAKVRELEEYNAPWKDDPEAIVNARRLTNLGTLRAYVTAYLRNHPHIRQDMTFLVRQLAPGPEGLPLEIYVFTNDTRWVAYEGIQADIFDHILAMVPEFGLAVYQRPSGRDLAAGLRDAPGTAHRLVAADA